MAHLMRRLQKEFQEIQRGKIKDFQSVTVLDSNFLKWQGNLLPQKPPYNKAAFQIEIKFTTDYPFLAPKINFITKIYHPNVDESGHVCLPIISMEHWKPVTKVEDVILALLDVINNPQPENAIRPELAQEYSSDYKKFQKKANDHAIKYGIKR
ncbi:ubiquitin-conjugating enzyme E2 L3-like [Nilaparvata lugens]|uniref:ubiquitin-conjugating enzyme E2 L3-like n=1 Tax=Nilaparvata lugens TaxID=108931 RepID=UPI00193D9B6F|nr:ubiquitin-conjugating enzyme E2 L3-like [Nilaparvata lugens]